MNPKDCKGKRVTHLPTQLIFVVAGGAKKAGTWYLKDEQKTLYLFDECQLTAHVDALTLKSVTDLHQLTEFHKRVGVERFNEAWIELESNPVEATSVALLYCDNWTEFCGIVEDYGVSEKQSPILNKKLKELLADKGLVRTVASWYSRRIA